MLNKIKTSKVFKFLSNESTIYTISLLILIVNNCDVTMSKTLNSDDNQTLRMVSIFFRHADRNPTKSYPTDPYKNYAWRGGFGALSEKGALQAYNLGENLRYYYKSLLPKDGIYSKDNLLVRSSENERCLMSAECVMAGFLPPNNNNLPINWQPVPIKSQPQKQDFVVAQGKPCPIYDSMLKDLKDNPPENVKQINKENANLYKFLTTKTGMNISKVMDVYLLHDTLSVEKSNDLKLPKWTDDVFTAKISSVLDTVFQIYTHTSYMKKIKGGPFLTEVINNMLAKENQNLKPNRNIFLYAAHDGNLVNIMSSLEISNQTTLRPELAAALSIELHTISSENVDEVKIIYFRNSEDKSPTEIKIPNCQSPCLLKKFYSSIQHLIINDYDKECGN